MSLMQPRGHDPKWKDTVLSGQGQGVYVCVYIIYKIWNTYMFQTHLWHYFNSPSSHPSFLLMFGDVFLKIRKMSPSETTPQLSSSSIWQWLQTLHIFHNMKELRKGQATDSRRPKNTKKTWTCLYPIGHKIHVWYLYLPTFAWCLW